MAPGPVQLYPLNVCPQPRSGFREEMIRYMSQDLWSGRGILRRSSRLAANRFTCKRVCGRSLRTLGTSHRADGDTRKAHSVGCIHPDKDCLTDLAEHEPWSGEGYVRKLIYSHLSSLPRGAIRTRGLLKCQNYVPGLYTLIREGRTVSGPLGASDTARGVRWTGPKKISA